MREPIIEDLLAWQAKVDASGLRPNMQGSDRFWHAVSERLGDRRILRDGAPECSEIVIELEPGVGLRLYLEDEVPFIRYEFVRVEDE
jgi:hypothetical protein